MCISCAQTQCPRHILKRHLLFGRCRKYNARLDALWILAVSIPQVYRHARHDRIRKSISWPDGWGKTLTRSNGEGKDKNEENLKNLVGNHAEKRWVRRVRAMSFMLIHRTSTGLHQRHHCLSPPPWQRAKPHNSWQNQEAHPNQHHYSAKATNYNHWSMKNTEILRRCGQFGRHS